MTNPMGPEDLFPDFVSGISKARFRPFRTNARAWAPTWTALILTVLLSGLLTSCARKPAPNELVMIIESSPTNLDPRVGLDAQSERIDGLLFDNLLTIDDQLSVKPGLAESWDIPDPMTYVFHLHKGVQFSDGRPLTSRDVKWSFDSLLEGKIRSTKSAAYRLVDRIDAPEDYTVVFHLKQPWAALLWNVAGGGGMGIVPYGTLAEASQHPIGSGPFRFVSAEQDKEVVIERNDNYWGEKAKLDRVRFAVVPDTTTRALELRKGSADIEINALPPDMVITLTREPYLQLLRGPGTVLAYMGLNLRDPILKDVRVRRAIAYALNPHPYVQYVWHNFTRPAASVLPPESWAYDADVKRYSYDPSKAEQLLDEAGYKPINGIRFHLTMKTSTEESSRAMAAVFQQQLHDVGIALDIRSFEFATFFSDISHGEFQVYSLRWIGGNEDPDIFDYAFSTARIIPNGANRQYYSNPRIDSLIAQASTELDQNVRKRDYAQVQEILAEDLPYINLWYFDNVMVYSKRVRGLELNPSGNYDFLKTAELVNP
ncbi:MAG TPA: ABC transporter substrate-binding protein [Candidatus Sulfotelmatobacter sp.]|nr:ABC transporter substrate-binding protein [Candidatus Sulfotelmatobacter sp.]